MGFFADLLKNAGGVAGHMYRVGIRGDEELPYNAGANGEQELFNNKKTGETYATNDWGSIVPMSPMGQARVAPTVNSVLQPSPTPSPSPSPTPTPSYRNPRMQEFQRQNPKDFQEITSGAKIASGGNPIVESIINDIAVNESGMRRNPPHNPLWEGSVESGPRGAFQFTGNTAAGFDLEDPTNATEAAKAVALAMRRRQLSRWLETVSSEYGEGGATGIPLDQLYQPEELNQYLVPKYQVSR